MRFELIRTFSPFDFKSNAYTVPPLGYLGSDVTQNLRWHCTVFRLYLMDSNHDEDFRNKT